MTYAVGYFLKFGKVDQEMFETQQEILWAALDGLDKFTDALLDPQNALKVLVDDQNGCKLDFVHLFDRPNFEKEIC